MTLFRILQFEERTVLAPCSINFDWFARTMAELIIEGKVRQTLFSRDSTHGHHRGPLHEIGDTARSIVTLLPDFLTRLQRLPLSPQAPHPRNPSTEPLYGGLLYGGSSVLRIGL